MTLILSDADVKALNPPMRGAVEVIERCCRLQACGDVTNQPRVHLAYPPGGFSAKREGFGHRTLRDRPA